MRKIYWLIAGLLPVLTAEAQLKDGHLSGSFESYTQYYQKDDKINAVLPQDRIGSNNFLKLDYTYKQFSAGIQFESYLPSIAGFPYQINQSRIVNKYFKYTGQKFSVQVGDFYEQFGSGLVFRAWENRMIGINNALEGASLQVQPVEGLRIKAVYGRQRRIMDYSQSNVRGADLELDFTRLAGNEFPSTRVAAGLSFVSRYQTYTGPDTDFPSTVNAGAARLDISGGTASAFVEYVRKGRDPHDNNFYSMEPGNALQFNGTIATGNFGGTLIYRSMQNMDFRGEREAFGTLVPVNYIPALTKQHDYLTTNIYVYAAQPLGENGGQLDLFYHFPEGKGLGGKHGATVAMNLSHYRGLSTENKFLSFGDETYFQDFSLEFRKKWNAKWNTIFAYHNLIYNKSVIEGGLYDDIHAQIALANILYRFTPKKSIRMELQHLFSEQDKGNWAAAVMEMGFAPSWTFFISDLYNYDVTDVHYPTVGGSYTKGGTRFGLNYGRQRAGLFCVGGICRFVPAATGITATLSVTFNN